MALFNLDSPNHILNEIDVDHLDSWAQRECAAINSLHVREIINIVIANLDDFIAFPKMAILLWKDCDRIPPKGKQKYHSYPQHLKTHAKSLSISADTRANGPAVFAFLAAGGIRAVRFGSTNSWSIHHLYNGKFIYPNQDATLHAVKSGLHFTQSAGLVAAHPIADSLCDEYPFFTWLLRARSFQLFGYDPDHVFGTDHDEFGFCRGYSCEVIKTEQGAAANP